MCCCNRKQPIKIFRIKSGVQNLFRREEGQNAAVGTKNSADRKIGGKTRDIDKTSARYTVSCRGLPLQPFRATKMSLLYEIAAR